jgi:CRP/FNR family cyclic AMP-dependent transcriptional regulator
LKTILLIEDNDFIRSNAAEILELSNYRVVTAENGIDGVAKAVQVEPDLIICDIIMPFLDGYGVLHAVQKNNAIKNTPFIFLTAKGEPGDIRMAMETGADDYIIKPFNGTDLLKAVKIRLSKIEALREEITRETQKLKEFMSPPCSAILQQLLESNIANTYKGKQEIYAIGGRPQALFYVLSGKIKTLKRNSDGKELVLDLYSEGDYIGYTALLQQSVYQETAVALEDSELCLISRNSFEELMATNKDVMHTFINLLAKKVLDKENQLIALAYI